MEIEILPYGNRGRVATLLPMMKLITEQSAARKLAVSIRRLRELVRHEQIPHIPLPTGETRFLEPDLDEWLMARRKASDPRNIELASV